MRDPAQTCLLAFDTSAAHCAAAVFARGDVQRSVVEEMAKGQAERILVLCQEVLAQTNIGLGDLDAIGVGVGPGNFTGIRISVSAARGLALSLGIPTIPVSTFEMLRDPTDIEAHSNELVVVAAPRGAAYAQLFCNGRPITDPEMIDPTAPPAHLGGKALMVTGHMCEDVARLLGGTATHIQINDPASRIAKITAWKLAHGHDTGIPPAPLYVRAADAAPARDAPPQIIA